MPSPNKEQDLFKPSIRLIGEVDEKMLESFLEQRDKALESSGTISLELMTSGGIADIGRRIGLEVELTRRVKQRELIFIGKTVVYSAGVTIMAAFPVNCRFLTDDAQLLIHSRKLEKEVHLAGPSKANVQVAKQILAQVEAGRTLEEEHFGKLITGSKITLEDVRERAETNWYLPAKQACELGLIAAVI